MHRLPRNDLGVATPPMRPWSRIVTACCLVLGLIAFTTASMAAPPQVKVSRAATSLPGTRYSWFPMPQVLPVESDPRVLDQQFRGQLQAALDKALQAKGYRPAGNGERADFVVAYRVGVRDVTQTTVRDSPASSAPQSAVQCGLDGCSQIITTGNTGNLELKLDTTISMEGGLLLEVLEPGSVRVLWRALNRGTVKPGKISQKRLDAVARNTLAQLPEAGR